METIPNLWWGFRIIDIILTPLMWVLNKCRMELPQETHPWHCIPWTGVLKNDLCVHIPGGYEKRHRFSPLFHMPLFGTGWDEYIVVQPSDYIGPWYIGWKVLGMEPEKSVNLLVLKHGSPVRVLIHKGDVSFFALDREGNQIKLYQRGNGHLGDGAFANVRQF